MSRYITDPKLNKKLEDMGLESKSSEVMLNDQRKYVCPAYDIADLLEPSNAKLLFPDEWIEGKFRKSMLYQDNRPRWKHKSEELLKQYQSNPDTWQSWLAEQLGGDEDE